MLAVSLALNHVKYSVVQYCAKTKRVRLAQVAHTNDFQKVRPLEISNPNRHSDNLSNNTITAKMAVGISVRDVDVSIYNLRS